FLAFAVLAERRGLTSVVYPSNGLYYLGGLTEATETLLAFAAMCLWPAMFPVWAYIFTALCGLTVIFRLWWGWRSLAAAQTSQR
ncbi:MAG: CDP-alcohol phosphatidyltransferase family protein, partial [Rubrivivax sp.]